MAVYYSKIGNGYQLKLTVSVASQDAKTDTTTLDWNLTLHSGTASFNHAMTGSVVIGGKTLWLVQGKVFNSSPVGSVKLLASGKTSVKHNADSGGIGITVAASAKTDAGLPSTWAMPVISLTGLFSPPPFPKLPIAPKPNPVVDMSGWAPQQIAAIRSGTVPSAATVTKWEMRYRKGVAGVWGDWAILEMGLSDRKIYMHSLEPMFQYDFQTRAISSKGTGPWSANTRHYFPRRIPNAPRDRPSVSADQQARTLTVSSSSPTEGNTPEKYEIQMRDNRSGSYGAWTTRAMTGSKYTFTPDVVGPKSYQFMTRAYAAGGWGYWSSVTTYEPEWIARPISELHGTIDRTAMEVTLHCADIVDTNGSIVREVQYEVQTSQYGDTERSQSVIIPADRYTRMAHFEVVGSLLTFHIRIRIRTDAGWSNWHTNWVSFTGPGSGPRVRRGVAWGKTNAFVKVSGKWKPAIGWVKHDSMWKRFI